MQITLKDSEVLSDTQLKFVKNIVEGAVENYCTDGKLMPAVVLHSSASNETQLVLCGFGDVEEKDMFAQTVRAIVKTHSSDSLVFISESWTIPKDKTEDFMANRDIYRSVSDYPDRQDCLMVSYETKIGTWLGTILIDDEAKTIISTELEMFKCEQAMGRFTNLLGE